ncbi:aminoglycoside adenylyltransferase domain-containing protein [Paenibacillus thalictri]|nr:aminoglycoside adenylyltransferase domain-containing protein [Paenibacillus thalictri]
MNMSIHWTEQLAGEMASSLIHSENHKDLAEKVLKLVRLMYQLERGEDGTDEEAVEDALLRLPRRWHALIWAAAECRSGQRHLYGISLEQKLNEAEAEAFARYAARQVRFYFE